MICLEKMLNFDDFTSLKFFYFLIVKKHQFYRCFLKKCLNLGFLYIRNGNSITTSMYPSRHSDNSYQATTHIRRQLMSIWKSDNLYQATTHIN